MQQPLFVQVPSRMQYFCDVGAKSTFLEIEISWCNKLQKNKFAP